MRGVRSGRTEPGSIFLRERLRLLIFVCVRTVLMCFDLSHTFNIFSNSQEVHDNYIMFFRCFGDLTRVVNFVGDSTLAQAVGVWMVTAVRAGLGTGSGRVAAAEAAPDPT